MFLLQLLVYHGNHVSNFIATNYFDNIIITNIQPLKRCGKGTHLDNIYKQTSNENLRFCIGANTILLLASSNSGTRRKS